MIGMLLVLACDPGTGSDTGDSRCAETSCDSAETSTRRTGAWDFNTLDGIVEGAASGDEVGSALAIGDATGDGVADVLVGGRMVSSGRGAAWLLSGPLAPGDPALSTATAHFTSTETVQLGTESCLGADLTGDGVGDIVLGSRAWMNDPFGGAAFLIPGPVHGEIDVGTTAQLLLGGEQDDLFGIAVSCGGDATGDGEADLLVGARSRDGRADDEGAAYLFAGPVTATGPEDARLAVLGEGGDDAAGRAVDLRSDLDGDGLVDVVVGAYRQSAIVGFGGAVYVVSGDTEGVVGLADADVVLRADEDGASAGRALSSAGDLNGDGLADLAVGLSGVNALAGAVAVLYTPLPSTATLSDTSARIDGEISDSNTGFAILAGVDLDDDGVSELGIGAPGQHGDGQGTLPGAAWLFYGPVSGHYEVTQADVSLSSTQAGAGLGYALAGGDLDGDDQDDVAVGSPFAAGLTGNTGSVGLFFGLTP